MALSGNACAEKSLRKVFAFSQIIAIFAVVSHTHTSLVDAAGVTYLTKTLREMKKLITLAIALIMMGGSMKAQETIQLPQPNMKMLKMKLGDALKQRRSVRDYQKGKEISQEQLSTILWAAVGINDAKSGRLTTPTAVNMQDIKVYVCDAKGVWLFNAKNNDLTKVTDTDLRPSMTARQNFVMDAPLTLLLVSDQSARDRQNERYGAMDAGYVSQDIYLACAAMGLKTVARAMMNQEAVKKILKLKKGAMPMLNHPIAYGKQK